MKETKEVYTITVEMKSHDYLLPLVKVASCLRSERLALFLSNLYMRSVRWRVKGPRKPSPWKRLEGEMVFEKE